MNIGRKEITITWFIENYSYCWHKNGEGLKTPDFVPDGLGSTAWYLDLFPRGYDDLDKGYISVFLNRCEVDDGPEEFPLKYNFSILKEDGSAVTCKGTVNAFKKETGHGKNDFIPMKDVLLTAKAAYLPLDTLKVQCKLRTGKGNNQQIQQITFRTRIGITQISFPLVIESFSTLEPDQKKTVVTKSPLKCGLALSCNMHFTDDSWCDGTIIVEITSSEANHSLSRCAVSLLNESGKLIPCGEADYRFDVVRKDVRKLPLTLLRPVILKRKDEFLSDDKLTLLCECYFSSGMVYESIEKIVHELSSVALNQISENNKKENINDSAEQLSGCTSALDDLKEMYNNSSLTDLELKTKTKSFPAHKIVLCARSSVFHAMLTNDMRERNSNCIQIDDLEDDAVQQFLLFLYSDHLDNLQWKSAISLYYAGDKYAVKKLKRICSNFLLENLDTSKAIELLLLADTHNDNELKKSVEDFIFKHEEQIFGSDEWENLLVTNPLLVSKTMLLKYKK